MSNKTLQGIFKEVYFDSLNSIIYQSNSFLSTIQLKPYNRIYHRGEKIICGHFENQLMDQPKHTKHLISWEE